jgi:Uma2 family endonuclease
MNFATASIEKVTEEWVKWVRLSPISFTEYLELFDEGDDVELLNGVVVERIAAQLEHERLFSWLFRLMGDYAEIRDLGVVLGSRTAVEVTAFRGRLPDLVFVRKERLDIIRKAAIFGAPDLVVEIVSPNDRTSYLVAREADYRSIGVPEIWFIDLPKQSLRLLFKREENYEEAVLTSGLLHSEALQGFAINVEWLLAEPRPAVRETVDSLISPP